MPLVGCNLLANQDLEYFLTIIIKASIYAGCFNTKEQSKKKKKKSYMNSKVDKEIATLPCSHITMPKLTTFLW